MEVAEIGAHHFTLGYLCHHVRRTVTIAFRLKIDRLPVVGLQGVAGIYDGETVFRDYLPVSSVIQDFPLQLGALEFPSRDRDDPPFAEV